MSLLFNARRVKCLKLVFPVVKHIFTNNNQRAIALPNSKQSFLTSTRYIWPNHKYATKSIILGFSLLGIVRLDETDTNRQLIDTIKRGILYFKVSKRLNYLEYNIVWSFVYHVSVHTYCS